jgi:hypothetical protein
LQGEFHGPLRVLYRFGGLIMNIASLIGRILVSLTAFALGGFLLLVLIGLWDGYEQETRALGFSGIYERYLASQAGFADDAKGYRAVVEAESAQTAVVAGTAAIEE